MSRRPVPRALRLAAKSGESAEAPAATALPAASEVEPRPRLAAPPESDKRSSAPSRPSPRPGRRSAAMRAPAPPQRGTDAPEADESASAGQSAVPQGPGRVAAGSPAAGSTGAEKPKRGRAAPDRLAVGRAGTPPAGQAAADPLAVGSAARRGSGPSARMLTFALVAALFVGLAGWAFWLDRQASRAADARREGLAAAVASAQVILSYDYRRIDADIAAATKHTTGPFRSEYADTSKTVAPVAKEYKAVVQASVKAASVVRAERDRVVALLFVDQSTRSTRVAGTKVDQARVRMTVVRVGQEWRVEKIEAI